MDPVPGGISAFYTQLVGAGGGQRSPPTLVATVPHLNASGWGRLLFCCRAFGEPGPLESVCCPTMCSIVVTIASVTRDDRQMERFLTGHKGNCE